MGCGQDLGFHSQGDVMLGSPLWLWAEGFGGSPGEAGSDSSTSALCMDFGLSGVSELGPYPSMSLGSRTEGS